MTIDNPQWLVPWDETLIRKYDINVPRYTSYPTAVQFSPLNLLEVTDHLREQKPVQGALSLYIHIPFCEHICFYCACNKIATKDRRRADHYLDMIEREMVVQARNFGHRQIKQLHLGGGTPTFLKPSQMVRLLDMISIYFDWSPALHPEGEYSIELDPREITDDMLCLLKKYRFNRFSFGVQDFDPQSQTAINRVQPYELVKDRYDFIRDHISAPISFDLIYGLPYQTNASFQKTWDQVLELSPDRISLYNYAHLPERFKPQRRINTSALPSANEKLIILRDSIKRLQEAGYLYIGMDHFAKPEDPLSKALLNGSLQRNFQGYSTMADVDTLALGVSAISQINGLYMQNHHEVEPYEALLEACQLATKRGLFLNEDDQIRQWAIGQLACQSKLDLNDLSKQFSIDGGAYFQRELAALKRLEADDLVTVSDTAVFVQPLGRLLLRPILLPFDAYFNQQESKRFSKVL